MSLRKNGMYTLCAHPACRCSVVEKCIGPPSKDNVGRIYLFDQNGFLVQDEEPYL